MPAKKKVILSKMVKHVKICYDKQHSLLLFVFDTFSFLVSEVLILLLRV
jgi:hypothetical protein